MVKYAHGSAIYCFFACFLLFVSITPVFGKGNKEPDLSKADSLIAAREYDEATLVLSDYIRRYPDKFELAHERLKRIYQIRDEFNRLADQLIYMLINDPDNPQKILDITLRLRELENDNSPLMISFVLRAQEIAQFNVYRNQLRDILAAGRTFLDRGDGAGAMQIYSNGMGLMKNEFFAAGFGARTEREVQQVTENINSVVSTFRPDTSQIELIVGNLTRAINAGQTSQVTEQLNNLTLVTNDFAKRKQELYNSVNTIDRILEELRAADPGMGDRNHLAFLTRIIHGRVGEDIQEGMLGAFDVAWRNSVGSVVDVITANIESIFTTSLSSFKSGEYSNVASVIARNESFINLSPVFFERNRQFQASGEPLTISLYGNVVLYDDIPEYLKIISLREASNTILQASNIALRLVIDRSSLTSWQEGKISLDDALSLEQRTRNNIAGMRGEFESIRGNAVAADQDISQYHDYPHLKDAITAIDNLASTFTVEERMSAQRYYTIESVFIERNLASRKERLANGRSLLDGQSRVGADGTTTVYRQPAEALEIFTALLSEISADIERGDSVLAQFGKEQREVASTTEVVSLRNRYQTAYNELNSLRSQLSALSETARGRTSLAESHRLEGERLFREAQAAFNRQDYATARNNVNLAAERFGSSLELQESPSIRATWNSMMELSSAIAAAEKERVIAEVGVLLNTAIDQYSAGNFQQAENNLMRAMQRWADTNTEEHADVVYWLGLVRGGTSARTSRVINPTEPLYPEMSQLLSQAQRNYDEGIRLINAGQRTQGLAKFTEARAQTREVKLMFPVNQQAGLLDLRMDQFTDPVAFNASFEQRLRTAVNSVRNQRSLEAYADILNLAEINPNYPNIRNEIIEAEYILVIRQRPANPANIARSKELTASARSIYDRNLTAQLPFALTQAEEAIRLDRNNIDAVILRERINLRITGAPDLIFSPEDEQRYQSTLREFQAGNYLVAFREVEILWQNTRYRSIPKLIDLRQRIHGVVQ